MTRIGISGHSNLTTASVPLVAADIRAVLAEHEADDLVGVSCLARGADQIFARVLLDLGGALEVEVPATDYRSRKVRPDNAAVVAAAGEGRIPVIVSWPVGAGRQD